MRQNNQKQNENNNNNLCANKTQFVFETKTSATKKNSLFFAENFVDTHDRMKLCLYFYFKFLDDNNK